MKKDGFNFKYLVVLFLISFLLLGCGPIPIGSRNMVFERPLEAEAAALPGLRICFAVRQTNGSIWFVDAKGSDTEILPP